MERVRCPKCGSELVIPRASAARRWVCDQCGAAVDYVPQPRHDDADCGELADSPDYNRPVISSELQSELDDIVRKHRSRIGLLGLPRIPRLIRVYGTALVIIGALLFVAAFRVSLFGRITSVGDIKLALTAMSANGQMAAAAGLGLCLILSGHALSEGKRWGLYFLAVAITVCFPLLGPVVGGGVSLAMLPLLVRIIQRWERFR